MLTPGVILTPALGGCGWFRRWNFGGKGWGSLHVELKVIGNTSTQHPVFLDIPWAQKNMWLVTSYVSYRFNLYTTGTRAGEATEGFGDIILGEEGWWSMHFHFITHAKSLKTTSVILPAKKTQEDFKPNSYKWPWDWFLGIKRFLRSLVKLGFKVSRSRNRSCSFFAGCTRYITG